eukprot:scaffold115857_cov54-Phaeocystis_antarctica.AAC.1
MQESAFLPNHSRSAVTRNINCYRTIPFTDHVSTRASTTHQRSVKCEHEPEGGQGNAPATPLLVRSAASSAKPVRRREGENIGQELSALSASLLHGAAVVGKPVRRRERENVRQELGAIFSRLRRLAPGLPPGRRWRVAVVDLGSELGIDLEHLGRYDGLEGKARRHDLVDDPLT